MKRTFAMIPATLLAAALFGGLVYALLVAAHLSEPAATTVHGLPPRRLWATTAALLATAGVVIGALALARPATRFGTRSPRVGAIVALLAGVIAAVNGGLNLAVATAGPGTGNGVVGGAAALVLGLTALGLGSVALARCRRAALESGLMRWHAADRDRVSDPRAFLMTTATRICLDILTSARDRREEYVGPWLPEPIVDTAALAADSRTELAEDLSIALLLILDRLSPLERAAFLLHDVFDFSFSEVAAALERSESACRQLAARARAHVRELRPRGATLPPAHSGGIDPKHAQLISAFAAATQSGDLNRLMQVVASDVRVVTDGCGKVRAAFNIIDGANRVATFLVDATRKRPDAWWRDDFTVRFATINGLPGLVVDSPEGPAQTAAFEIEGDVVRALYVVRNPDKLRHLAATKHERGPE